MLRVSKSPKKGPGSAVSEIGEKGGVLYMKKCAPNTCIQGCCIDEQKGGGGAKQKEKERICQEQGLSLLSFACQVERGGKKAKEVSTNQAQPL